MKPFDQQNYYELLEVGDSASDEEIRAAYNRAIELFNPESVALYGLADASSVNGLRARLLEAMEILTDADLREEYNKSIGIINRRRSADEQEPTQLAMKDILAAANATHSTRPEVHISYIAKLPVNESPEVASDGQFKPDSPGVAGGHLTFGLASEPKSAEANAHAYSSGNGSAASARQLPPGAAHPSPEASTATVNQPKTEDAIPASVETSAAAASEPTRKPTRNLEIAADISHETAIATAEANMAQVAARVREVRPEPRPKPVDLPPDVEFNGEVLRHCRESRGIGLMQLCDRTRISGRHLENVEADRYNDLPATVYLRGILVSIARELGLDPQQVSRSYLALVDAKKGK
jgi:hypothetical protein